MVIVPLDTSDAVARGAGPAPVSSRSAPRTMFRLQAATSIVPPYWP
jgi:hypothetical protein